MRNTGLEEAQAGIKIAGRNVNNLRYADAAAAKSLQSCPTLCDPTDGSPPGSPGPGILQARTLEWAAIAFSHAWKWKVKVKLLSRVQPSATPWTAAFQAPPSMGSSRQEDWSGGPLPSLTLPLDENIANMSPVVPTQFPVTERIFPSDGGPCIMWASLHPLLSPLEHKWWSASYGNLVLFNNIKF